MFIMTQHKKRAVKIEVFDDIKVIYSQNFHRDLGCAEDEWRVKGFTADDMGILLGVYSTESAAVSAFENLMTAAADGSVAYVMPADEEAAIC